MNAFDLSIVTAVNAFARHSVVFDKTVVFISDSHLLKGGVLAVMFWWAWFREVDPRAQQRDREHLVATLVACVVAIVLARLLALSLPFRERPLHEAALNFVLPTGLMRETLEGWSSFPSDHAVLFFALATGLWRISRPAGVLAFLHTALFICGPRLYLGIHYPTDLLAGAALGIGIARLCDRLLVGGAALGATLAWSRARPGLFHAALFLFTYQTADIFDDTRAILRAVGTTLRLLHG